MRWEGLLESMLVRLIGERAFMEVVPAYVYYFLEFIDNRGGYWRPKDLTKWDS